MTVNLFTRFVCALLLAVPVAAYAETGDTPPLPDRNPSRHAAPKGNAARVEAPEAEHPVLPGDAPTVAWTDAEVAAAKAECAKKLAGVALEYEPLPPLKEGLCGAPAPIRVSSIGSDPKVTIDPPATVTCSVAAGLSAWLAKTVQPKARALIGAPVIKLHNATSYACRNRYGGETTPLSEHALANALDVSEFVFQTGKTVTVLAAWPHVASVPPAPLPMPTRVADESSEDNTGSTGSISTTSVGQSIVKAIKTNPFVIPIDAKSNPFVVPTAAAKVVPMPGGEESTPDPQPMTDRKGEFVRKAHDEACNVFGTVLGPEANEAHKNHFHLDMKKRRHSALCE